MILSSDFSKVVENWKPLNLVSLSASSLLLLANYAAVHHDLLLSADLRIEELQDLRVAVDLKFP